MSTNAKTKSPERLALAQAIDNHAAAVQGVAAAEAAAMKARDAYYAADHRLEALRQEAEQPPDDSVIDSLAAGADVATLTKPAADLRADIAVAEQQVETWRAIRNKAEEAIEARKKALDWSASMLDDKARAVVEAEFSPDKLMEELRQLRQQTIDKSVELWAASRGLDYHHATRKEIEHFVTHDWIAAAHVNLDKALAGQIWRDAFTALKSDAAAPLPTA